jgi:hypothetical protein
MTRDTVVEVVGVGRALVGDVEGVLTPQVCVGGAWEGEGVCVDAAALPPPPALPLPLGDGDRVEPPPGRGE